MKVDSLNKMKRHIIAIACMLTSLVGVAQTGYQVALINTATGEPRAHETVSVSVEITDAAGGSIYTGSQSATSNEFGIISLSVGSESTFDKVDWNKLPLYISATVDGVLIGKTQILTVPVAEYAKRTGVLTPDILCSKTWTSRRSKLTFNKSGGGYLEANYSGSIVKWWISGNIVLYKTSSRTHADGSVEPPLESYLIYIPEANLFAEGLGEVFFQ